MESSIKLFTDVSIIYRKIMNDSDIDTLQIDVDRLGEWAAENLIKINPGKSKAVSFMRAQVKDSLNYIFGDQRILDQVSANI